MNKRKLDINEFTYDAKGNCENPKVEFKHEADLSYSLLISQCHAGWLIGWHFIGLSKTGVSAPCCVPNGVSPDQKNATIEVATKCLKFFFDNGEYGHKDLLPLKQFFVTVLGQELPIFELKKIDADTETAGTVTAGSKVVTMQQVEKTPEQLHDDEHGHLEFMSGSIVDDFLHYTFRHVNGHHDGFKYKVTGTGIVSDELKIAFSKLNLHLAVIDECFKSNSIDIVEFNDMHNHQLTMDYLMTAFKIKGNYVFLEGSKHVDSGTRMGLKPGQTAMDNLSSYKYWAQLFEDVENCRNQIALYHDGEFTKPEKPVEVPKLEQKSLFDQDAQAADDIDDADFEDLVPKDKVKGKVGKKIVVKKKKGDANDNEEKIK